MSERQTALIIGGGTGIGFATAQRLSKRGVAVALSGRRDQALQEAKERLQAEVDGAEVVIVAGDSGVDADARRIAETAINELRGVDLCVNGAGIYEPVDFLDMDEAAWRRTLSSSLDSMVYPSVPVAAAMKEAGHGRFVLISSINSPCSKPESSPLQRCQGGGRLSSTFHGRRSRPARDSGERSYTR